MNKRERRNDDDQSPFQHEAHATNSKLQHASAPKVKTSDPPIGNQKQVHLQAGTEEILESKRKSVDQTGSHQELLEGEDCDQLWQGKNRHWFEERSQGACGEKTKPYPTPNSITSQQGVA